MSAGVGIGCLQVTISPFPPDNTLTGADVMEITVQPPPDFGLMRIELFS